MTQTLVILPRVDTYNALRSVDAAGMKSDILGSINSIFPNPDRLTFIVQDELSLKFYADSNVHWLSCLSQMDNIVLGKINSMPPVYWDIEERADKVDKAVLNAVAKEFKFPPRETAIDDHHYRGLRLGVLRSRISKVISTIYGSFDCILYFSKGPMFIKKPEPKNCDNKLIALISLKSNEKTYYYSGLEVTEEVFNQIKEGIII